MFIAYGERHGLNKGCILWEVQEKEWSLNLASLSYVFSLTKQLINRKSFLQRTNSVSCLMLWYAENWAEWFGLSGSSAQIIYFSSDIDEV